MKKVITIVFAIVIVTVLIPGCKKKKGCTDPISIRYDADADEDDGSCSYAGLGGNTTIVAYAKHHGNIILNKAGYPDSAFVKFNTQNSPGISASDFDAIFVGETGEDHVHMAGLKTGKYFIMMTGLDTTINKRVSAGIPFILTQSSGEVDLDVPVSE